MEKDNKMVDFLKGSLVLVGANVAIKAINFFLLPLYTEYLSPKELGISDSISTLTAFIFPLLVMGLDSGFTAFYYDQRSENHIKKVFNTTELMLILLSCVPIIMFFFSRHFSNLLFNTTEYSSLIIIALASVTINMIYIPFSLIIRMEKRMTTFAIINVIASLSMIILNIIFVSILEWGASSLIISGTLVQLIQLILYVIFAKTKITISKYDRKLCKSMLRYSIPLVPAVLAGWALSLSDRYIILGICSESDVGLYGIAARFSSVIAILSNAIYMSYAPFAFDKKDDLDAKQQYSRILNGFFILLLGICFTISLFGREIVVLMTSKPYFNAYLMLPGILFGQLAYGIITIVGYGISFSKKTGYTMIATISGAAINIVLNFIFIPKFGAVAASYTTFAGYAVMLILIYIFAQKLYPCDYKMTKIVLTTCTLFVVLLIAFQWVSLIKLVVWIIAAVISCIVFREALRDYYLILKSIFKKIKGDL